MVMHRDQNQAGSRPERTPKPKISRSPRVVNENPKKYERRGGSLVRRILYNFLDRQTSHFAEKILRPKSPSRGRHRTIPCDVGSCQMIMVCLRVVSLLVAANPTRQQIYPRQTRQRNAQPQRRTVGDTRGGPVSVLPASTSNRA
jgi:hypothetical protein